MSTSIDQILLNIVLNLSTNNSPEYQYHEIIDGLTTVFPCDAACLLIFDQKGFLTPVAVKGVSNTVLGRRYLPKAHPRLDAIIQSKDPVRFDAHCDLPDPFDGTLLTEKACIDVHDCMGCSLYVEGQLVGALTMDALMVGAFDNIDTLSMQTFAALTAATMRNIAQVTALKAQNQKQKDVTQTLIQQARSKHGEMVGNSPQLENLKRNIAMVAQSDYSVLIMGETGTGKELVAHAVHAQSRRSDKPMIYVNCAALPEALAESELFGHVKGAFTGALTHRTGKFELADGGTLFLDEVGELPLLMQAKLLRVIQQGEVQRVGSDQHIIVNVRIVAATNRNLDQEVANGQFRADLYHRLNVFPIHVPPLREHAEDIALLTGYLLDKVRHQFNSPNLYADAKVISYLESQPWYGNVRELEHVLTRAALHSIQQNSNRITLSHLDHSVVNQPVHSNKQYLPTESQSMRLLVEQYQRDLIQHALQQSNGVWAQAAQFLQVDRGNLYRMGKKLGLTE
ncbi:nitric oxide reductase transcriptional regulator NorR [Vibrio sp.]|nr:nitric oxide reductase transcriptional regulator NorR [Vibrio sp.]